MKNYRPRILMFAPYCYPPAGSEAIATAKLLLAALEAGWEVDVISQKNFGLHYPINAGGVWKPLNRIVRNIEGMKNGGIGQKLRKTSQIRMFGSFESICWTGKAISVAFKLLSSRKYDFVLSRAAPQYGHLPALALSKRLKIPWITSWSDPMPLKKAPPPYGEGPKACIPSYLHAYYSAVARKAEWHIFPCQRLSNYMSSYIPELAKKSSVVPHIALERFRTEPKSNHEDFSMCYTGSLTQRDPHVFLDGVKRFLNTARVEKPFRVRFVGLPLEPLRTIVGTLDLAKIVSIEEPKTYEETQEILAKSDVSVALEAHCEEGIFFPSKFVDFVQTGRPILAVSPINGTLSDILTVHGGGIVADCGSADAVSKAIGTFYSAWKTGSLESKYGSSRLFNLFCEKVVIDKYLETFNRQIGNGG